MPGTFGIGGGKFEVIFYFTHIQERRVDNEVWGLSVKKFGSIRRWKRIVYVLFGKGRNRSIMKVRRAAEYHLGKMVRYTAQACT